MDRNEFKKIIHACQANDRLSQSKLFQLLESSAARVCYRYHSDSAEAADVLSEAFLKLFKNINSFELSRCQDPEIGFRAWFKKILINTSIDHLRKGGAQKNQWHSAEHLDLPGPGENGADRLTYKEIIHSIRLLPPAYRAVFNLYVIEGMRHEEISRLLKISVGASKSNLFKARKHLKNILEQSLSNERRLPLVQ